MTIDLVYAGYKDCRKRKTNTQGYLEYYIDYIANNAQLYEELVNQTYKPSTSKTFCVTRPKLREVFCAQFKDRIVHHILTIKFLPLIESVLVDNAYACRKGKGVLYGVNHIKQQIESISNNYTKQTWVMTCDIKGFFMSINREQLYSILEDVLRTYYKESDIEYWLWLWKVVILNAPEKNCVKVGDLHLWDKLPKNKSLFYTPGLPIGNLPSQILANLFMLKFDKWILSNNVGYGRYVDDFAIISNNKQQLLKILEKAKSFLKENLNITLHPNKIYLQEVKKGVKIMGIIIKPHRTYVNNRVISNIYTRVYKWNSLKNPNVEQATKFVASINSLFGLLRQHNTYAIRFKIWTKIKSRNYFYCVNMKKLKLYDKFR